MEIGLVVFFLVLQAIICGFLAMNVAKHKGHSSGSWFACGIFFGIFGLIAVAGLPTKQGLVPANRFTKKCPDCVENVSETAKVCKFCGYRFISKEDTTSELKEIKFPARLEVKSADALFYSEAHNSSEIIKKLQKGEYIIALSQHGELNEWLKVKILDKVGYIMKCDVNT